MNIVSDASPLIVLSGVGLLSFLKTTFKAIHIKEEIRSEIVDYGKGKPGSVEVAVAISSWIEVHPTSTKRPQHSLQVSSSLSKADASVITLASDLNANLVLVDEAALRSELIGRGFKVTGSGGLMVLFKDAGHIDRVEPYLAEAVAQGLRLDDAIQRQILFNAKEL